MKKRIEYPIVGAIISALLFSVGITTGSGACLTAGVVCFLCNAGLLLGILYRARNE